MIQTSPGVTDLLARWHAGDEQAGRSVLGLVYEELRRVAGRSLRHESPGHTLQPTALAHEAWMRLAGANPPPVSSRAHLIAIAARLMRQILVNHALRRKAAKRGGGRRRIELDPAVALFEERCIDLIALDEALARLRALDERMADVVEMRFFGGLTVAEVAEVTDGSVRTVERDWTIARAWLRRELEAP